MTKLLLLLVAAGLPAQELAPPGPLELTLHRAIEIATSPEGNTNVQLSGEALRQAQTRVSQVRAALLPDFESSLTARNQTQNLAALGLGQGFLVPIPGFHFPTFVGPFNTVDARVTLNQTVFDFSTWRRYQASKTGVSAAQSDVSNTHEVVAAQVARAYLLAQRSQADVESAEANVALSEAVLTQTGHQKEAGTGTGIEVTRARVQLANDRQHLLDTQNQRRAANLRLKRAIGMRLDIDVRLTDKLEYIPVDAVTLEQARAEALRRRPDLQAQQQREIQARQSADATKMERIPSVAAFADYGTLGTGIDNGVPTRTYGVQIRVPIFDGGKRDARRAESASQYRQERVRSTDLKEQVELDVRLALDELHSAEDQVKVAREGLQLSENELTQARRRYDAGVSTSLEVTDAQTRLERARDNQTAALYLFNLARVDLSQAVGRPQ
jgi:outer membrane protein TolC